MATGLLARDAPEILGTRFAGHAFCGVEWDFVRPLKVGDTIYVRYTIGLKEDTADSRIGMVHHHVELVNQDDVVLQRGVIKMVMRRRGPVSGDSDVRAPEQPGDRPRLNSHPPPDVVDPLYEDECRYDRDLLPFHCGQHQGAMASTRTIPRVLSIYAHISSVSEMLVGCLTRTQSSAT